VARHHIATSIHGPALGPVRLWLLVIAGMVGLTAVVGAATRLTGSGLSITEWNVIGGVIPPLSEAQWLDAFDKYRQIPQYRELNRGMSLDAFKAIFWWEWAHRLLARGIGFAFALPLIGFALTGRIPSRMLPRLAGLLVLGGLQGAVGWYMVKSGLVDRIDVSQYRLALHLGLAVLIFALLIWTCLDLGTEGRTASVDLHTLTPEATLTAHVVTALVFLQVLLGALVAGLKAGKTYNTWPLMDGALVPDGLFIQAPWYRNIFENAAMVQFNHRMMAYIVVILTLAHAWRVVGMADARRVRISALLLAIVALAQTAIGIWTLLAWVPVSLGVAHQVGALALMAASVAHLHAIRRS